MPAVSLGPFVLDSHTFMVFLFLLTSIVMAMVLERRYQVRVEGAIWLMFISALVVGRLVFVWQYWDAFQTQPWSMLDIRDGGLNGTAAVVTGVVIGLIRYSRFAPVQRNVYIASIAVGAVAWSLSYSYLSLGHEGLQQRWPSERSFVHLTAEKATPKRLSDYEGKPTVLNLWATWCPPCQREMPVLEQAQHSYPEVNIVLANQQENATTVEAYLEKQGLELDHVLLDPDGELMAFAQSKGLPTTLFLDANGQVLDIRMGEVSAATLEAKLQLLLEPTH